MTVETGLLHSEINGTTDVLRISGIQHGDVIVLTDARRARPSRSPSSRTSPSMT